MMYAMVRGPTGRVWIGTADNLVEFDYKTDQFRRIRGLRAYSVHEIQLDTINYLWVGTFGGGLLRLDLNSGEEIWYKHDKNDAESVASNLVDALLPGKLNGVDVLWVGTMNGLDRYDYKSHRFVHYNMTDGLPHNHINSIVEDGNGKLWITTKVGLSHFDPIAGTFKNYWKEDGLPGNGYEFNSGYCNEDGEIFIGGSSGLVSFYPDSMLSNPVQPTVVLTGFEISHKPVPIKSAFEEPNNTEFALPMVISRLEELHLSHREQIISFTFAALDFRSPMKNRYAYFLEGFEDNWNYTDASNREATYTNLDHGNYTFRVKGSNNDGLWNDEGVSLKVIISPPWWETQMAYLGYLLVVAGMVIAFWRFQVSKIKLTHQVEMEHLSAEHYHELDEHKSRFMANISHEFRTPLTLIIGPVSNLIAQIKDQEMRADLSLIQRQAKRLLELVVQLLDISKLDDNRMILQVSQQNIVPLLRGLVLSFASLAERNKIDLNFESTDENIQIFVEREAVVKILNNLLSNAFKFTEAGNTIMVGVSQSKESLLSREGEVIIRVSDTGIGIPENHLAKVFDRFHQVDNTETRQWGGTGIGLSLTKELVDLHKGSITVDSNPQVGTVFTIRLPLGKDHLDAHEIVHPGNLAGDEIRTEPVESDQENSRIYIEEDNGEALPILLIVEDNIDVRNYIRSYLEKSYQCHEAVDGQDGLEKVRELIPDLVVSDIMMPKMNGLEFCRHMKSDERTSHIPVLMLTAKADIDSKVKGLETGADAYLTKPFEAKELKIRIKNLIDQRQALRERFQREFSLIPSDLDISSMDRHFLERAVQIISDQLDDPGFKVDNFAQKIFMSRQQLSRKLRALTGRTAVEFIRLIRLKRAAMLLGNNHATITEIAYKVGFSNPSHFSRSFHQEYGKTPSAFLSDQKKNNSE
ncbi:MAG: response regulator [FCB group bacterium]|nr:response regulator [FCB group bacterium]